MFSKMPYLIRAFYQWIVDNGCTPYLMVEAEREGVVVPPDYVENGQIILNIKPEAIRDLEFSMRKITFRATFAGQEWNIFIPLVAVKAIYAQENGEGIMFDEFDDENDLPPEPETKGKPNLRIVE
ncbi:MAG: ClpXP protease specificity-enhancing factor [Gammaproteobacteria bacterium RIFCSPHIGHO2_12_FULL_35_23]|nr:MAG: ClpXP protease specificity-enhancing factor [Gammaproteobacteria bacterium RIFCSPHIGHO2_12_FULL_35_23]